MDGDQFDQITRSLARNVSRRSVVRGLSTILAGSAVAARPLSGEAAKGGGGPDPCNVYCAAEPGPRGAQCRQACKECGGPTSAGFCYDERSRSYTCCPSGLRCFDIGLSVVCCSTYERVCYGNENGGGGFCCADGTHCAEFNLCCPIGVEACYDPSSDSYACGASCYDLCSEQDRCGEPMDNGQCAEGACYYPCAEYYVCGPADEQGNCPEWGCHDPCNNGEMRCGERDSYGNGICIDGGSCFDPAQETYVCGSSCFDNCSYQWRCGTSEVFPPYCDDNSC